MIVTLGNPISYGGGGTGAPVPSTAPPPPPPPSDLPAPPPPVPPRAAAAKARLSLDFGSGGLNQEYTGGPMSASGDTTASARSPQLNFKPTAIAPQPLPPVPLPTPSSPLAAAVAGSALATRSPILAVGLDAGIPAGSPVPPQLTAPPWTILGRPVTLPMIAVGALGVAAVVLLLGRHRHPSSS